MTDLPIICEEELLIALLRYLPEEQTYLGGYDDDDNCE